MPIEWDLTTRECPRDEDADRVHISACSSSCHRPPDNPIGGAGGNIMTRAWFGQGQQVSTRARARMFKEASCNIRQPGEHGGRGGGSTRPGRARATSAGRTRKNYRERRADTRRAVGEAEFRRRLNFYRPPWTTLPQVLIGLPSCANLPSPT